jgi:dihydroorotase
VDCHAHFREPGQEYKEDIASGLAAAAHGGFGSVMCMANTAPVNDTAAVTRLMLEAASLSWPAGPRLYPVGAATMNLEGTQLAPMAELAEAGCVAFSNDGKAVDRTEILRRCVEYAADLGRLLIDHCEDHSLAKGWVMNEGGVSGRLGLKGQPDVAEAIHVARAILLADYLSLPIHLAHISCRRSVELIAWAKSRNVPVTAETCPQYLLLADDALENYSSNAKVSPPLRSADDIAALRAAVRDGTIDCLATDHAPHAAHEKEVALDEAPCGITGLDTALALTWSLVREGALVQEDLVRLWLTNPAKIFKLPANTFAPGDPADFILFDPDHAWLVSPENLRSKSANTPWLNRELRGRVRAHWLNGVRIV